MSQPIIYMDGVNKSYGAGEARVQVLYNVTLSVQPGEFVALLGPSGSGKSTLMNLIGLIDTPDDGRYYLAGENTAGRGEDDYAVMRNRRVGFVFQKFNLISKFSALENVAQPLLLRGFPHNRAMAFAGEMLCAVGLSDRLRYRPNQLSGGQQQRVAIARALIGGPDVLLADEPTGALDTHTGREILSIFRQLNARGRTIILITHDLSIARQAGRIIHIEDGRVREAGREQQAGLSV